MGWLHPSTKQLGVVPASGDQNVIALDPFGVGGRPNLNGMLYPDSSYEAFARNGFSRNELVYACIMEKAQSLPQGYLRVYPEGSAEPIESHRLRQLIVQPNPVTNEFEFFELSVVHLDLAGNCYWLINRGRDGLPAELWPLRPDLVRIIPDAIDPRAYDYAYILDPSKGLEDAIRVSRDDVIHIKYPNPLSPYFGLAPLRPAARAITVDNGRTDFVDTLLRNDAVPRAVITTQQEVDVAVLEKLRRKWIQRFSGENRGSPAFLQAGMDVKILGLDLKSMEFGDLTGVTESRICMALNVPPILISAKIGLDRSTFANYREARASFWEETLIPLQMRFLAPIVTRLLPEFMGVGRSRIEARWDNSQVPALKDDETNKWKRAIDALTRGGIRINEFRKYIGLDPLPGGDVFLIPAGVNAVGSPGTAMPTTAATGGTGAGAVTGNPAPEDRPDSEDNADQTGQQPQEQAGGYARRFLAEISSNGSNGHG